MTKILTIISALIILSSCGQKSRIFKDCRCDQVDLKNGMTITDSLNHFQISYPNSSWLPLLNLDTNGNGITVGDTSLGYLRMFAVTELKKGFDINNWILHQKDIELEFNVIDKGLINLYDQQVHWNLVKFENDDPVKWTLYLTVEHPTEMRFYTLNLTVEDGGNVKKRICTLESFLNEFELIE